MSAPHPQRSIPKFASFKPRPTAPEPQVKPESDKGDPAYRDVERERGKRHHRRHKSRSPRRLSHLIEGPVSAPEVPKESDLFSVDRKGDRKNLVYGSIHEYSIPYFHRAGAGSVMGAEKALKIDRNADDGKAIILDNNRSQSFAKREKYIFSRSEKNPPRPLKIRAGPLGQDFINKDADFVPLRDSRKRRRTNEEGDFVSDDEEQYRSIEGKARSRANPEDYELDYATNSDSSDSESRRTLQYDEATKRRTVQLSRRTKEHPQDIEAWTDLIQHQDHLLGLADDSRRQITSAERSSTAEIKIHLYETALKNVDSSLANRERIFIGLMAEGAKIWTFESQFKKWKQISEENLDSILLGKHYLDFRQSSFPTFRYEDLREIYLGRIRSLVTAASTTKGSETDAKSIYTQLFYAILRATLFMREAGYAEIAVAIWQALIEYNWYDSIGISNDSRLELFRDFWESEVPRIGEDGASGWGSFISHRHDGIPISSANLGPWARNDVISSPTPKIIESAEDDPYGVVLWSDIEGFMFQINREAPQCLHDIMIDAFLLFCRLPPLLASQPFHGPSHLWLADAFVRSEMLEWKPSWIEYQYPVQKVSLLQLPAENAVDLADSQHANSLSLSQQSSDYFVPSIDTMLASNQWVNSFTPWRQAYDDSLQDSEQSPVKYSWLLNVLRRLILTNSSESLSEYYLCFEWHNEPQYVKKTAKYLLKRHPDSLRLYNGYAMIERLRGNKDTAQSVITAALSMSSIASGQNQSGVLLWKTRIWWFLEENDHPSALKALLSMPDNSKDSNIEASSPALQLKSRQFLTSARDSLLSTDPANAILYAELLLLLACLTSDVEPSIQATFTPFSTTLITRARHEMHLELFHQAAARLIHHHIQSKRSVSSLIRIKSPPQLTPGNRPYRPAFATAHLATSLSLFPSNTIFLSLHHAIAPRIVLPLPSSSLTPTPTSLSTHLFHIRRCLTSPTQNPNLVLSAFESAIGDPVCHGNPGLWRLYLLYCVRLDVGEAGRAAAKNKVKARTREVFWRAVRACPWARGIYLMALSGAEGVVGRLELDMDEEERRVVWRVLGEKELRGDDKLEERFGG